MKLMIASDIHGSKYYCGKLMERWNAEAAGRLILLGDILYHGPRNDLPEGYYVLMNCECKPELPAELDRVFKITDGILRSIIVAVEA